MKKAIGLVSSKSIQRKVNIEKLSQCSLFEVNKNRTFFSILQRDINKPNIKETNQSIAI